MLVVVLLEVEWCGCVGEEGEGGGGGGGGGGGEEGMMRWRRRRKREAELVLIKKNDCKNCRFTVQNKVLELGLVNSYKL